MADPIYLNSKPRALTDAIVEALRPICVRYTPKGADFEHEDEVAAKMASQGALRHICGDFTIADAAIAHAMIVKARAIRGGSHRNADGLALWCAQESFADFISCASPESIDDVAARVGFLQSEEEGKTLSDDNRDTIIDQLPKDIDAIRRGEFYRLQDWEKRPTFRATRYRDWCSREEYEAAMMERAAGKSEVPGPAAND